jgi:tetratricopeptide (TPR) repeat protein
MLDRLNMTDSPMRCLFWAVLLATITFAAYAHTARCGWIWDDDDYLTENAALERDGGMLDIWFKPGTTKQYYPLVFTTFKVERQLWGLNPAGYHLVNVALHALGAILWWRILRRLNLPGAWMAAAIFALHPVHVESVAWVTERKNVLSGVLYAGALLAWLRFCPFDEDRPPAERNWAMYALALALFVLALLSKTVTSTLPAAIALGIWWKRGRIKAIGRRDAVALAPMLLVGIAMGLFTVRMEQTSVGATGGAWDYTFVERSLIAGRALWFYASKLFWPAELIFIYPRWRIDSEAAGQWLYLLAALGTIVGLWLARHRIGRGPLAGVLFFAGTLFPALGFFNIYPMRFSFVADHFQYLASMGVIVPATAGVAAMVRQLGPGGRRAAAMVCCVLLVALGVRTWAQTRQYTNAETLWRATIRLNPDAAIAHNNLGAILQQRGEHRDALSAYHQAIRLEPDGFEGYFNVGEALSAMGHYDEAVKYYRHAVESNDAFIDGWLSLAVALEHGEHYDEAIEAYAHAVQVAPQHFQARYFYADALHNAGRLDDAIEQYEAAVRLRPDDATVRYFTAAALAEAQRDAPALVHLDAALALLPSSPQRLPVLDLAARLLTAHGRRGEALQMTAEALQIALAIGDQRTADQMRRRIEKLREIQLPRLDEE